MWSYIPSGTRSAIMCMVLYGVFITCALVMADSDWWIVTGFTLGFSPPGAVLKKHFIRTR